jgi:hypothetical protein
LNQWQGEEVYEELHLFSKKSQKPGKTRSISTLNFKAREPEDPRAFICKANIAITFCSIPGRTCATSAGAHAFSRFLKSSPGFRAGELVIA